MGGWTFLIVLYEFANLLSTNVKKNYLKYVLIGQWQMRVHDKENLQYNASTIFLKTFLIIEDSTLLSKHFVIVFISVKSMFILIHNMHLS